MFNNNKNSNFMTKNQEAESGSINLIGAGTSISGEIKSSGDIRIDGNVTGIVNAKGKLVVGPTGFVEGDVVCLNADISGTVQGNITVSELLSIKASANIKGEIITNKLSIETGANFTGNCSMGGVVKDIKQVESTSKKAEKTA
jgi:cytoskeletal protein CcmA (bactofilin family)